MRGEVGARWLGLRLLGLVPTFVAITLGTFALGEHVPGDVVSTLDSEAGLAGQPREDVARPGSLLSRYGTWVWGLLHLDLGRSLVDGRPVGDWLLEALPPTLTLVGTCLVLTYGLAVPLGAWCATASRHRARRLQDLLLVLFSVPSFWLALALLTLLADGTWLAWFPLGGLHSDGLEAAPWWRRGVDVAWHLVLPTVSLLVVTLPSTIRLQESALAEALQADHVRTARAKGLPARQVLWRHAWPGARAPMLTRLGMDLPWLLGGSVVIERVFTIRGMGMLTVEALLRRDHPMLLAITALGTLLTMAGMVLSDVLLAWCDPRHGEPP